MEKANKKVICINGDSSKNYEQVIFIMKNGQDTHPNKKNERINFVSEAERIINEKLNQGNKALQKAQINATVRRKNGIQQVVIKRSSLFDVLLNSMMLFGCVGLSIALILIAR